MSKIQINELNNSELEVLNAEATTEVVGGFSLYRSKYYSKKSVSLEQVNLNENTQVAFGGGKFSSTGNSNYTSQYNSAYISQ